VINKAVIIDGKPHPPRALEELVLLPGAADAIESLHLAGWLLIVVTNQPDVARGVATVEDVEQLNQYLLTTLAIDEIRCCYHDDRDGCTCRKPLPGALIAASDAYGIDLSSSYMVGDRWKDIAAGQRAGCKTIYIDHSYDERLPETYSYRVHSLAEAALIILGEECEAN
jgi:D-glycero-D-manno-heptose 1,7-bisphosphate phosphatase